MATKKRTRTKKKEYPSLTGFHAYLKKKGYPQSPIDKSGYTTAYQEYCLSLK